MSLLSGFFDRNKDAGILIMRIGVGLAFASTYGLFKIQGGPVLWEQIGTAMNNLGIGFGHLIWGFIAMASEFFGGIFLILGLFTRTTAFFMAFTMFMASFHHLKALDPWHVAFHPMELFSVFVALMFLGAGKYSVDRIITNLRNKNSIAVTK